MPDLPPHMSLPALQAMMVAAHPDLRGLPVRMLTTGWESVALDVDDRWIIKFPRDADAATELRREARLLAAIRPHLSLPVPDLVLFEAPTLHSRHRKLPGSFLDPQTYDRQPEPVRKALGATLAQFYAELHAIRARTIMAASPVVLEPWWSSDHIRERIDPLIPPDLRAWADAALAQWAELGPDPHGSTFGFFDGHGWNMAFDETAGTLNGVYDFGDAGIAPLHQEFTFSNQIAPDFTARIVDGYEALTGRGLDRARILLLTDMHRLWEIAVQADDPATATIMFDEARAWLARRPQ